VRREVDAFVEGAGERGQARAAAVAVAAACARAFEGVVADVRDGGMHVHAGLFALSVRCMLGVTFELVSAGTLALLPCPPEGKGTRASDGERAQAKPTAAFASDAARVQVYGHSMGGACAAFVYAWLRDLVGPAGAARVACVCLSTPRIVDEAARAAWFRRHDDDAALRHYFTRGDVVVHALPSFAGLTHHPTRDHYRCPMAPLRGYARLARAFYAHVVYQPLRLRRLVVREGARWSSRIDEGRAKQAFPRSCRGGGGAPPPDPREPFVLAAARYQPVVDVAALAQDARHEDAARALGSYLRGARTGTQRWREDTMEDVVFDTPELYATAMRTGTLPI
jgi:acetyl esterase/lipase